MGIIKVIIGGNYGDEGKGRMTNYFSSNKTLVIRANGGAQAGHTVVKNKNRHIFSHFGSGTMNGSSTYLAEKFIINPKKFKEEYLELNKLGYNPVVFVNENCFITTIFDVLVNQITEISLSDEKYGSCGMGIWETINRCKDKKFCFTVKDCTDSGFLYNIIHEIKKDYMYKRIESEIGSRKIPDIFNGALSNETIEEDYLRDLYFFIRNTIIVKTHEESEFLKSWKSIIFEGAQGLLLDIDREVLGENTTPSHTGIKNISEIIERNNLLENNIIEVIYCTRWYMTRHGKGILENSCTKEELSSKIKDDTNIKNEWQDEMRFAPLDTEAFQYRILSDFYSNSCWKILEEAMISVSVTCLDQCNEDKKTVIDNFYDCFKKQGAISRIYYGFNENSVFTNVVSLPIKK